MAGTLVTVFLFSYSVSLCWSHKRVSAKDDYTFSKAETLPVNPDTQYPFEEKKKSVVTNFKARILLFAFH